MNFRKHYAPVLWFITHEKSRVFIKYLVSKSKSWIIIVYFVFLSELKAPQTTIETEQHFTKKLLRYIVHKYIAVEKNVAVVKTRFSVNAKYL